MSASKKKLALIGSGDLALQLLTLAVEGGVYEPVGFFDDTLEAGTLRHGLPVLGSVTELVARGAKGDLDAVVIAVGYMHMAFRDRIYRELRGKLPFASLVSPHSYVAATARVGEGSVIFPGCVVDMRAAVEANVLLYNGCHIAHDSVVGTSSMLSPTVSVAGFSKIGERAILGIGTIVSDNLELCADVRTGAGAVVVRSISESGLYLGCPAKKKHDTIQ